MNIAVNQLVDAIARLEETILLAQPRYQDGRSLAPYRAQVYSQNGEDGALAEIFRRLDIDPYFFVEIGAGDGEENNTRFLLECGGVGIWWEGDKEKCEKIKAGYRDEIASVRLKLVPGFVTAENVEHSLFGVDCPVDFDLLSIDVDMNTSHIWKAMVHFTPKVAVIEYNPNFPPSLSVEVPYDPAGQWREDNWFGASLKKLETIGEQLGYCLVGCDLSGINAFFVRKDLADEKLFLSPFTAEQHYEPPRLHFLMCPRGHHPAKRT